MEIKRVIDILLDIKRVIDVLLENENVKRMLKFVKLHENRLI